MIGVLGAISTTVLFVSGTVGETHRVLQANGQGHLVTRWWFFLGSALVLILGLGLYILSKAFTKLCGPLEPVKGDDAHDRLRQVFNNVMARNRICRNHNSTDVVVCCMAMLVCDHLRTDWETLRKDMEDILEELGREHLPVPDHEVQHVRDRFRTEIEQVLRSLPASPLPRDTRLCTECNEDLAMLADSLRVELRRQIRRTLFDPFDKPGKSINEAVLSAKSSAQTIVQTVRDRVKSADGCYSWLRKRLAECLDSISGS